MHSGPKRGVEVEAQLGQVAIEFYLYVQFHLLLG